MIVSLFYVSFVTSFLEKGGKALLLASVFPVRCQTSFLKTTHDLTGLHRAWWFCHHVNSFYIVAVDKWVSLPDFFRGFPLVEIVLEKQNFCPEMSWKCPEILIWNSCGHHVKATQNKLFQATTVNIKDFSMARYLFCSKKCYRRLWKWLNSETQEVYLKLKFLLYWFHQIGMKELHAKFQVINFIFTGVMTFLIFSKFASTPTHMPKNLWSEQCDTPSAMR